MSRHPQYEGRYPTICCEEAPDVDGFGITYACTRRRNHRGYHEATLPSGEIAQRWATDSCLSIHHPRKEQP